MTSKVKGKSNRKKRWQLNITVFYNDQSIVDSYRVNILECLRHLASIYRLDYATSVDHQISSDSDSIEVASDRSILDLFYFQSNEISRLEKRELRKAIDCMFYRVPSQYLEGVDVQPQPYKLLKAFPFPLNFCRPMGSLLVEHHKNGQKKLRGVHNDLKWLIEREQDQTLN